MFRRPFPEPMRTARVGYMMTPPEPGCNDARNFPRETPCSHAIRLGRLFVDFFPVQKREEFQAAQATWKVRASSGGSTSGRFPRSRMSISARPWRPLLVHACRRLAGQRQARARRLHCGEFCLCAPVVRTMRLSPRTKIGRAAPASGVRGALNRRFGDTWPPRPDSRACRIVRRWVRRSFPAVSTRTSGDLQAGSTDKGSHHLRPSDLKMVPRLRHHHHEDQIAAERFLRLGPHPVDGRSATTGRGPARPFPHAS